MSFLLFLVILVIFVNTFLVFTMIFIERKKPNIIVSWLLALTFLPIIGFILYLLIGSGLNYKTTKLIKRMRLQQKEYVDFVKTQKNLFSKKLKDTNYSDLVLFNLNNSNSACFHGNSIKVFLNGEDKVRFLKRDLINAKSSINILYYIFADDKVGNEIMDILINKAKEGVKVKLIYDSIGSFKSKKIFFKKLKLAGGEVAEFFPPIWGLKWLNLKANYRNHRKIVVIDGKIGYTGGINIRDDHMGRSPKIKPWRDTHIRIIGKSVYSLQTVFFSDWRYCKNIKTSMNNLITEGYFPTIKNRGDISAQLITSGPDYENQPIKESLIKMILSAKSKICIQTPYFIPDNFMIGALNLAKKSGVDIKIILPSKPDKKFVYAATLSYVKELIPNGINFYAYKGFIHSKIVIIDDKVVSVGTCNLDSRSFSLNFEINAFLYNENFAKLNLKYFDNDLKNSKKIDSFFFKRKPWTNRLGQAFFRLFSPLL